MDHTSQFAAYLAEYFYEHLKAEQEKKSELIDGIRFDGKSAREINGSLIREMERNFPGIALSSQKSYNLFDHWAKLNEFALSYEDFAFEAYNLIFYQRIVALNQFDTEHKKSFHLKTREVFELFDTDQEVFSISFFLRSENNMRELLRIMLEERTDLDFEEVWNNIFEQSKQYQEVVNEFFESLLREANRKNEELLHNIMPVSIATEMKENGSVKPIHIPDASVLFTDFQGFTALSAKIEPVKLLATLDECFSAFDEIIDEYGLEKIKTIGDAYMCAGSVPRPKENHLMDMALASLKLLKVFQEIRESHLKAGEEFWNIRIGFHKGPLIAGVIGTKKLSYDIWGDTVNTASRMESTGEAGKINVSGEVQQALKDHFHFQERSLQLVKGLGMQKMHFLLDRK